MAMNISMTLNIYIYIYYDIFSDDGICIQSVKFRGGVVHPCRQMIRGGVVVHTCRHNQLDDQNR